METAAQTSAGIATGDIYADGLLRFISAYAEQTPKPLRTDYCNGVLSMFFDYQYLAFETGLRHDRLSFALEYLHLNGFLNVEIAINSVGVNVWMRARIVEKSA